MCYQFDYQLRSYDTNNELIKCIYCEDESNISVISPNYQLHYCNKHSRQAVKVSDLDLVNREPQIFRGAGVYYQVIFLNGIEFNKRGERMIKSSCDLIREKLASLKTRQLHLPERCREVEEIVFDLLNEVEMIQKKIDKIHRVLGE